MFLLLEDMAHAQERIGGVMSAAVSNAQDPRIRRQKSVQRSCPEKVQIGENYFVPLLCLPLIYRELHFCSEACA